MTLKKDSNEGDVEKGRIVNKSNDSNDLWDWLKTLLALVLVIGLILLARQLLKRSAGQSRGAGEGDAIEVIARARIAPRQELILVRLGERLELIGSGPNGPVGIAEVTSPAEARQIIAMEQQKGGLASLFRKKTAEMAAASAVKTAQDAQGEGVAELKEKIRKISRENEKE